MGEKSREGPQVPESQMREVWRRDDFTCRYCGRIVVWEELHIMYSKPLEEGGLDDTSNMISVCEECLMEGKKAPVAEEEKRRILGFKRDIETIHGSSEDVVFEESDKDRMEKMARELADLREDNRRLQDELNDKTAVAIAYKKKMDRTVLDLENYKRRSENEVTLKVRQRTRDLALSMIDALDNIDRAIRESARPGASKEASHIASGFDLVRKAFIKDIQSKGIVLIDPLGQQFDPKTQEAVGAITSMNELSDTVVQVLSVGYLLEDQLLRPARVMVSKGGPRRPKKEAPREEITPSMGPEGEPWEEECEEFEVEEGQKVMELEPPKGDGTLPTIQKKRVCRKVKRKVKPTS